MIASRVSISRTSLRLLGVAQEPVSKELFNPAYEERGGMNEMENDRGEHKVINKTTVKGKRRQSSVLPRGAKPRHSTFPGSAKRLIRSEPVGDVGVGADQPVRRLRLFSCARGP